MAPTPLAHRGPHTRVRMRPLASRCPWLRLSCVFALCSRSLRRPHRGRHRTGSAWSPWPQAARAPRGRCAAPGPVCSAAPPAPALRAPGFTDHCLLECWASGTGLVPPWGAGRSHCCQGNPGRTSPLRWPVPRPPQSKAPQTHFSLLLQSSKRTSPLRGCPSNFSHNFIYCRK